MLRVLLGPLVSSLVLAADDAATRTGPPARNLLQNASFEEAAGDQPLHWRPVTWSGNADFELETRDAHEGAACLKLSSREGADASWAFALEVEPGTDYRLSAWVKTREVDPGSGLGALVNLHQLQKEGKTEALSGTTDWTLLESTFHSGDHRRLDVNLLLGGWGQSRGEAWFDAIEVVSLTSPRPVLSEAEARAFYAEEVHPILEDNCFRCHGEGRTRANLFLESREGVLYGGDSGPAVNLTAPAESLLLSAIRYQTFQMPPKGQLAPEEIEILTRWVRLGVPVDPDLEGERPHPDESHVPQVNAETRQFWSFRPVERPAVPALDDPWVQSEVDAFLLQTLRERQLAPAPPASKVALLRRACYDLIGLPPSPADTAAFLDDGSPDAYERLIDRLLASPHYGEKWARHWLDLVRYAESNSFERDSAKPLVWRYRDYVIDSLNADKPYDRFVREQLAGDELEDATAETITATGFYRLGQWDDEPADPEQARFDELDDILATTGQVFLGLTVNCARCHDHKLDPFPQTDYYRLLAFLRNVRRYGVRSSESVADASLRVIATAAEQEEIRNTSAIFHAQIGAIEQRLREIEGQVVQTFEPVEFEEFRTESARVEILKKRVPDSIDLKTFKEYYRLTDDRRVLRESMPRALRQALCVTEHGAEAPATHVLIRGNPHVPGEEVQPGFPQVLSPPEPVIVPPKSGASCGRRLALARWITSPDNPLFARVMVNRLWQYHFGRGLVRSANNFGLQGDAPTHPELLDWLASEFVAQGFSIKRMHRMLMLSSAYRMATEPSAEALRKDPENDAFSRFPMRRLTAEEIRDSILAVNERLNRNRGGPSVFPLIADEVLAGQSRPGDGWHLSAPAEQDRRSIYVHVKRSLTLPLLAAYDAADPDFTCPVRFESVQPTQALSMLNSDFLQQSAAALAASLRRQHPGDEKARIEAALFRVTQRPPRPAEIERGREFVARLQRDEGLDAATAFQHFCLLVLNLNEFLYLN